MYPDPKNSGKINQKKHKPYDRWIIVEQDKVDNPVTAARHCRQWLKAEYGI